MKTLFMETTEITPERTVAEIETVLSQSGASSILKEFENKSVAAVSFKVTVNGQDIPFRLPCRWQSIQMTLAKRNKNFDYWYKNMEKYPGHKAEVKRVLDALELKAKRIAWRQILRWIQAQLALVETDMVRIEEVFMPYMQLNTGKTLFETVQAKHFLLEDKS